MCTFTAFHAFTVTYTRVYTNTTIGYVQKQLFLDDSIYFYTLYCTSIKTASATHTLTNDYNFEFFIYNLSAHQYDVFIITTLISYTATVLNNYLLTVSYATTLYGLKVCVCVQTIVHKTGTC